MGNTKFVSTRYNNFQYAPGLSLYGIDGRAGVSGKNGASLFICIYDINDTDDRGKFGNAVRHGNTMTMEEPKPVGRSYCVGDTFLFPDGKMYSIKRGTDEAPTQCLDIIVSAGDTLTLDQFNECMSYDGRIVIENQSDRFTSESNRLVLNTNNYKGFVINNSGSDDISSIEAPLTIIGSQKTAVNGIERYLDIKSIQTGMSDAQLRFYYDENNNTYVIESDRPICIDADFTVKKEFETSVAGYSSISTTETPITSFKGVCENTHYTTDDSWVRYEYYTDKKTCQVYKRQEDERDLTRIYDGPERTDKPDDDYFDKQGVTFLRYSSRFTYVNDGKMTVRACKKISVQIFRSPDEDEGVAGIPIFIQFTNRNSEGNEQVMDAPPVVLMDAEGNRTSLTNNIHDIPSGRLFWKTESIYVPSESDNFIIVIPSGMKAHVMVFGEGAPAHVIDETVEQQNYEALKDLFSNGDDDVKKNRFPVDVLRNATAHYYRTFDIAFEPDDKQTVPQEVLPNSVHIKGLLNGMVDIEFYKNISDKVGAGGFSTTVEIDSYRDIATIEEWSVSLIGVSEIEINEPEDDDEED